MKPILFFDTETTGLPLWKDPSDHPDQPHMVQLAAVLADPESREIIDKMDAIIKPDGWVIPDDVAAIHGITTERALEDGIPEAEALDMFLAMYARCGLRVAHNTTFDNRIVRIAMKRYRPDAVTDDQWKDKSGYHCTMVEHSKKHGGKWPTLIELYKHHTGMDLTDAHSAMADTLACMDCYFAAIKHQPQEEAAA